MTKPVNTAQNSSGNTRSVWLKKMSHSKNSLPSRSVGKGVEEAEGIVVTLAAGVPSTPPASTPN